MKKAIIIFTRVPIAGMTKTRMMPTLTPEECKDLHTCFLKDIKRESEKVAADIFVAYTPENEKDKLVDILDIDKIYFPQIGNSLGEKMYNAIKYVLDEGYNSCVLIGTDIPEIRKEHLEEAFTILDKKDVVFGPTKDGGYYLVGMKKAYSKVFENQSYGHGTVLENTIEQLKKEEISTGIITELSDIDIIEDLRPFRNRVRDNKYLQNTKTGKYVIFNNKISIILPIYNEESTILDIQNQLYPLKNKCEIIFVDGGSKDKTLELISEDFKVIKSKKGRANQMNLGAKNSKGDTLFFLHSDSKLPQNPLRQIEDIMKDYKVGCFGIAFNSRNFFMFTCRVISNFRAKYRRIIFGDQGMFIDRELFFEIGGFPDLPIMEDYQFSLTLKNKKEEVGMTKNRIYTSDRRYPKGSIPKLKLMWKMYKLRKMYRNNVDINLISSMYRDIR